MSCRPLIKETLNLLNIWGTNPMEVFNFTSKIRTVTFFILFLHLEIELILQCTAEWNGWASLDSFQPIGVLFQALSKLSFMSLKRKQLQHLIETMGKFWRWNYLNQELQQRLNLYIRNTKIPLKLFTMFMTVSLTAYVIKPLLAGDRSLPFDTYHPINRNKTISYATMYVSQVFNGIMMSLCLFSFDCLFISFVVNIFCEIEIIKFIFSEINAQQTNTKYVRFLIRHHDLVLRCISEMDATYSWVLLMQLFSSISLMCFALANIIADGFPPDFQHISKYGPFFSTSVLQLFIYCFVGVLVSESNAIAGAIYESKWWDTTPLNFKKACILISLRANKKKELTAAEMFPLNLESFTKIMKFAMSFFTVTMQLKESKLEL